MKKQRSMLFLSLLFELGFYHVATRFDMCVCVIMIILVCSSLSLSLSLSLEPSLPGAMSTFLPDWPARRGHDNHREPTSITFT